MVVATHLFNELDGFLKYDIFISVMSFTLFQIMLWCQNKVESFFMTKCELFFGYITLLDRDFLNPGIDC